jgi:proteasome lid subunit RPN8/RPN11
MKSLLSLYEGNLERVGFVLKDGSIVEVANICADPENGFEVSGEDLLRYEDRIAATWHTHPNERSNLSVGDHHSFLNYPDLLHHIIGNDGVSSYEVKDQKVFKIEKRNLSTSTFSGGAAP